MTMGTPSVIYRWYYGAYAIRMLKRNILEFMGVAPVRSTLFGAVESVKPARRQAWIAEIEALGRAAR